MTQNKSFNIAIDKTYNTDQQMMKKAGNVMGQQIREQFVPFCDEYTLGKWASGAGHTVELTAAGANVTGAMLITGLLGIETHYNNKFVDTNDRYVAVRYTDLALLRESNRWASVEAQTDKYLVKGKFEEFGTLKVFGMPDAWFPAKVRMIAFQSKAVLDPMKIKTTRIITDSENIDGDILQGHFYFDAFVIGRRCDGVVTVVDNGYKAATPTVTKSTTTTAIASATTGANIYYTTDGSDPRYSASRVTYSAAITNPDAGVEIKAVAEKIATGNIYWSDVVVHTCA